MPESALNTIACGHAVMHDMYARDDEASGGLGLGGDGMAVDKGLAPLLADD